MTYQQSKADSEKGASLVEFAVLAPLLLLLIFGVFELARGMHEFNTIRNAAREGARFATTSENTANQIPGFSDCAEIEAAVRRLASSADPSSVTIEYYNAGDNPAVDFPKADCDLLDPTYPAPVEQTPPPTQASFILNSGDIIVVTAEKQFDSVVPLLEQFLDGIDLTSVQERSIFFNEVIGG